MVSLFEKAWHLLKDDIEIAPRNRPNVRPRNPLQYMLRNPPRPSRRDYQRHAEKLREKKEKKDE